MNTLQHEPSENKRLGIDFLEVQRLVLAREHGAAIKLIEPWIGYTAGTMLRFLPPGVQRHDLVQAGRIGAWMAMQSWNVEQGEFAPFAHRRMRGAMTDHLRSEDYVSRQERRDIRAINNAREDLTNYLGRKPTPSEVAEAVGIDVQTEQQLEVLAQAKDLSFDVFLVEVEDHGRTTGSYLQGDGAAYMDPMDILERREREKMVDVFISILDSRKKLVFVSLLAGTKQKETADDCGVTSSRITQITTELKKTFASYVKFRETPIRATSEPARTFQ